MEQPRIVAEVGLSASEFSTGYTRHFTVEGPLPAPSSLRIVQFSGDVAFYLLYLDEKGHELTDTWHRSLEDALEQARLEFGVVRTRWRFG